MKRERGTAIIMAMLVMALSLTLVSGVFWRQSVLARQVENQAAYVQTRWLMTGAIDWVRVILREDQRASNADHFGEPWSVPLAETRLEADNGEVAFLSGTLSDEQGKFNLQTLVIQGRPNIAAAASFERLLGTLRIDARFVRLISQRVAAGMPNTTGGSASALPVRHLEDLLVIEGLSIEAIEAMRPLVTVLPESTPVNPNTAPAGLLAVLLPELGPAGADRAVSLRTGAYFRDVTDFWNRIAVLGVQDRTVAFSTASGYFLLSGQISFRKAQLRARALLHRHGNHVDVIWMKEDTA